MQKEMKVDTEKFARDGYLHFPGVFSAEEVQNFREFLVGSVPKTEGATALDVDLLTRPETESFINDGRVLGVARQLLNDTPVYFGDSSAMRYPQTAMVSTFHKDNSDRHDYLAPDWQDEYPLIRFGVYLQDHRKQGGGLLVRAGSHRTVAKSRLHEVFREEVSGWLSGKTRYLFAGAGDLIVWNMRLTHAGMGRFLKGPIKRPLTERNQKLVPEFMQAAVGEDRLAMFASFGKQHPLFDRYLESLKMRKYMVQMWQASSPGEAAVRRLEENGGRYLDMSTDVSALIAAGKAIGMNDRWAPLPY